MRVVHIEVAGDVQGVGFRWFIRELARRHNISGWVRNLSSGNVEVAAAGAEDAIEALLAAVREGPPGARVRQVLQLRPQQGIDHPHPFTILK